MHGGQEALLSAVLAGLKDKNDVLTRLLQNQVDLGNIIKPYYGEQGGNKPICSILI